MNLAKKKKTAFVCQACGYDTSKWVGKCPGCGAWNTLVEETIAPNRLRAVCASGFPTARVPSLSAMSQSRTCRAF